MTLICDECGQPCEIFERIFVLASDEWGDQAVWGEASECCGADWHELEEEEEGSDD